MDWRDHADRRTGRKLTGQRGPAAAGDLAHDQRYLWQHRTYGAAAVEGAPPPRERADTDALALHPLDVQPTPKAGCCTVHTNEQRLVLLGTPSSRCAWCDVSSSKSMSGDYDSGSGYRVVRAIRSLLTVGSSWWRPVRSCAIPATWSPWSAPPSWNTSGWMLGRSDSHGSMLENCCWDAPGTQYAGHPQRMRDT